MSVKLIAIFASGKGSNAQTIIKYFTNHPSVRVALVITNNPEADVIKIAHSNKIISAVVSKEYFGNEEKMCRLLDALKIEFIVLAGFLRLIPDFLIRKFPRRIINIHPALLPKHGGKGMYGMKVHEAVLSGRETETGITIHYVNENYDEGEVILQKKVVVKKDDTIENLSTKVQRLEHEWYPKVVEQLLTQH